jgi:hypothetical protein
VIVLVLVLLLQHPKATDNSCCFSKLYCNNCFLYHFPGTSDPYVKFKLGSKQLYKSRTVLKNLNPKWDERFVLSIEDVFRPILLSVYDYDRGRFDDSMGSAELNLENLKPNE